MIKKLLLPVLAVLLLASCEPSKHPNQISDFDGKTYDSFVLAHGALGSLRETVRSQHPELVPAFNTAAHSYGLAYDAYVVYRLSPQTGAPQVSLLAGVLASAIQTLEHDLTNGLPVQPGKAMEIRRNAAIRRGKLAASRPRYEMSLIDILTALQTGAQIAQTIPTASPYATLALLVINATESAVNNSRAAANQPIDLSLIAPIAAI
jgi:hypothetical protein